MHFPEFYEDKETNDQTEEEALHQRFFTDLRCLQSRSKCTEAMCVDIVDTFAKYMNVKPADFRSQARKADRKMQEKAGVKCVELHGCVGCDKFVFTPDDGLTHCPRCGDARFDNNNKPREVCFVYFLSLFLPTIILYCLCVTENAFFSVETQTASSLESSKVQGHVEP
jgi:hypothetical protein